jgi:PAS domain S-box-containing protein
MPTGDHALGVDERAPAMREGIADCAAFALDREGRIASWNVAAECVTGYRAAEIVGQSAARLYRPEDVELDLPARHLALAERDDCCAEEGWRVRRDGTALRVDALTTVARDGRGNVEGYTTVLRDIGARHKAAEALQRRAEATARECAAERDAALAELHASERRAAMLFDANPHPMWIYDPETFAFLAVNDAALRQYGYTREEFLRMTVLELQPPEDRMALTAEIRALDASRQNVASRRHRRKDGEPIDIEARADGIVYLGRRARLVLANDVTERNRAQDEIRRINTSLERRVAERTSALEAANAELEAFSYSVSHDLRAPLRHIDGYADLLRESAGTSLSAAGCRYLDVISDSVTRMGALIDDLLSFSRMGRSEMHRTSVPMGALVEEARQEIAAETAARSIEWQVGPLPDIPGDRAMLKQVWVNLLSNAVKYTRTRDPARIAIGCTPVEEGEVEFFVADNGVGFDAKYTDKLFRVFQRLHRTDEFEGTGVGLANVRRIVARHGGRTRATGTLDAGATFFFNLPTAAEEQE